MSNALGLSPAFRTIGAAIRRCFQPWPTQVPVFPWSSGLLKKAQVFETTFVTASARGCCARRKRPPRGWGACRLPRRWGAVIGSLLMEKRPAGHRHVACHAPLVLANVLRAYLLCYFFEPFSPRSALSFSSSSARAGAGAERLPLMLASSSAI